MLKVGLVRPQVSQSRSRRWLTDVLLRLLKPTTLTVHHVLNQTHELSWFHPVPSISCWPYSTMSGAPSDLTSIKVNAARRVHSFHYTTTSSTPGRDGACDTIAAPTSNMPCFQHKRAHILCAYSHVHTTPHHTSETTSDIRAHMRTYTRITVVYRCSAYHQYQGYRA